MFLRLNEKKGEIKMLKFINPDLSGKKLILLALCLSLFSLALYAESNIVPMEKLREIADKNAASLWGDVHPTEAIPYYSVDDEIVAYAFNYAIDKSFPDKQSLIDECESKADDKDKYARWGVDEYAHLIMSNSYDRIVTIRHIKALSDEFAYGAQIRQMAVDELQTNAVNLDKIYYLSPMLKYYKYIGNGNVVYVRIFPPMQTLSQSEFQKEVADNYNLDEIIPKGSRSSWDTYLSGTPLRDGTRAPVYIPHESECVPFLDWSFGCSPTAGAMLLDYWDNYSYYSASDYGNLTQYHYQRWDHGQGETDYNVTNAQYWCCIHMDTDSLTGSTGIYDIGPGLVDAANCTGCGSYSFSQTTTFYSTGSNPTKWAEQVDEIDNGRPWHCGIPDHSMTAIGYEISAGDSFMIVHNTWHPPNDWWNYTNNYRITEAFPGGQYGCAVILEKPEGDPGYNHNGDGEDLYAGNVYEITWDYDSFPNDYAKLYYSNTGGKGTWYTITSSTDNDGVYDWVIPSGLSSTQGRIKVEIWDGSGKAAADGSWGNFKFHSGGSLEILGNDSKVNTTTDPDYYQFNQTYSTWCAVGVRCNTTGENWSMKMYTDNTFTTELVSSAYTYPVDFVVMDRHHSPSVYRGIKAYRPSGSNNASVEYEGSNETITPGTTYSTSWPAGDVVEMWDVYLTPGDYCFELAFNSGSADLDIALFGSSSSAYYGNRQDYLARSINSGGGVAESFSYTVTTSDYYGFCVWANDASSANYDIDINQPGTWEGDVNHFWNTASNWSCDVVPTSTTNVNIPAGTPYTCWIASTDQECNDITIESGASLRIYDEILTVSGNMTIHGHLQMEEYIDKGTLIVNGNITWESGSTSDIQAYNVIRIYKHWYFNSGADVQLDDGIVEFTGSSGSRIYSYEDNCHFNNLWGHKTNSWVSVQSVSTEDLNVEGSIFNYASTSFYHYSSYNLNISSSFDNRENAHYYFNDGTLVLNGISPSIRPNPGDYLHNLTVNTSGTTLFNTSYSDTLEIQGNLLIQSGALDANNETIIVGGNWTNNVGTAGFIEGTGRVIFNGSSHQYVYSDETFNILEVDCGAALRVNNVSHTVTCSTYDWTSGGIDVLSGTFTALDLEDSGIYGGYWLNPGGTINLHQDGGSWIDLRGDITISGGTMNVYGGSLKSYWPYLDDASITMSGGILDFKNNGIFVCVSGAHTLTEDITGGTIRTSGGFTGDRADFNPTGGTIELYGTTDANMSMGAGSNFYDVEINKSTKARSGSSKAKEYVMIENRDGTRTRYAKSETIYATSELDINGDFVIDAGVFDPSDSTMYVAGDWTNNVGDAGFIEGTGLVVFDGANAADILTNETFYDLNLDKTYYDFDGLETGTQGSGVDVIVTNDLRLYDGTMELNNPTNLAIGNTLRISDGASLNANDTGTINISVVEDWFDYNASGGFSAGSNSVVTFNGTTPGAIQSVRENDYFNDIVINSGSSYVRPSSLGPTIYCENMDIVAGKLKISTYKVVVEEDITISGTLEMSSPDDSLIVNDIIWESGSSDIVTDGKIFVSGNWTFADGTSAQLGTGNAVYFDGSIASLVLCNDSDAEFGTLIIDKTAGPSADTYIHASSTDIMRVSGDMTVSAGNQFHLQTKDLLVDGTLDIEDAADMDISSGGTLTNNSDFTLNGLLDVDAGDALIHGTFELATTGTLTINGGSFKTDEYTKEKAWRYLRGTFNLSDGLFWISDQSIWISSTCMTTISGGIIRTGIGFSAQYAGTFEPSGGLVELTTYLPSYIYCSNGNYFHDLIIDKGTHTQLLGTDVIVNNDLNILSGALDVNGYDMYIGGNWTNNVGDTGFVEGTGKVTFNGINESDITTDETFYDLSIDKTAVGWEDLEIMDGFTIDVTNDLNITVGNIEMNTGSTLNIDNDLDIALNAGLNAYSDTGLNISVGGNWTNDNTYYDSWRGFYPGTSTVTFNGTNDQIVTSSCSADSFYNVVIDKSAGNFRPSNNVEMFGDLNINDGFWYDLYSYLTHSVYGDFTVTAGAGWSGTTGNTLVFKGTADQTLDYEPSGNGYFNNVVVDKTAKAVKNSAPTGEELLVKTKEKDGSKAQTVTLISNCIALGGGSLTNDEGTLNLNGHFYRCTGNVTINDGGTISIDDNAWLEVGGGAALNVNNGGVLEFIGSAGNLAKLTHHSGYYDVEIESGSTIIANYGIFEYMSANGVNVKDGAVIDPANNLSNCEFRNGIAGGTLLTINNNQTLIVANANFPTNTWSGASNVSKTQNQGHVEFFGATGDFAGPSYENDAYALIDWSGFGPDLTITNAVWSDTNPYVCDTINVAVTVKNIGNVDVTDWFCVDLYYNLPSPPTWFQVGDQFVYIDSGLPAGDSLIVNFYNISSTTGIIWSSYFQVDADSNIAELDENNNVWGPDAITWNALPAITDLTIQYNAGNIELNWTYPASVDSFYIYRDTEPYFTPAYGTPYASVDGATTSWSEPATGTKYFYIVTAVKSCPSPLPVIMKNKEFRRVSKR